MDNKITKGRIAQHLEYDWLKYLAIIAAAIFAFVLLYTMTKPRAKVFEEIKFLSLTVSAEAERNDLTAGVLAVDYKLPGRKNYPRIREVNWEEQNLALDPTQNGYEMQQWLMTRFVADQPDFMIAAAAYFDFDTEAYEATRGTDNEYGGTLLHGALARFDGAGAWTPKAADGSPLAFDAAAFGFTTAQELAYFEEIKYTTSFVNKDGSLFESFVGFRINKLHNIGLLYPSLSDESDYIIALAGGGGNVGNLNRLDGTADRDEAYAALKYFIARYR
jgi:hypothetical protein